MNPDLVEYDKTISKGSENETQNEKRTIIEENKMSGRQYDNRGEFIVQADNTTSKADELTVETGQMVSSVKLIRESWLRRESNEKGGVFPKQWVKEKEEVTQQRKNAAQVHTDRKHNYKEENISRVDVQEGPVEKSTNKICKVGDNIKADQQSCFQEEIKRQTGHCFEDREDDQLKKYSYEDDKIQIKPGLDVKRMVERRLYPDEIEQGLEKDSQSTEQLTTPVKTTVTDETPETSFMKSCDTDEISPDIKSFINFLGLDEYFPNKMQVRDVMKIELSQKTMTFKEIALMFIKNIIMINLNGRDRLVQENLRQKYKLETGTTFSSQNYLTHILKTKARATNREINPLDLTIAVFKCASPMLKHTLASNFLTCQLAVPFAFPKNCDEDISISLIPLLSMVIECRSNGNPINEVSLNCPCHVVSFLRFGILSVSKSKLANEILNDQCYSTFFCRDCPLGSSNRCISDGLIEAAWYLPSRQSNFLSNVTTFLNLRGDANRFHEQLTILSKISTILVILIDVNSLNETITSNSLDFLLENVNGIVIAIDAYSSTERDFIEKIGPFLMQIEQYPKKIQFRVLKIDQVMRNSADVRTEMRDSIRMLVDTIPLSPISSRLKDSNLNTNEDIECYRDVQRVVNDLWELFPKPERETKDTKGTVKSCANVKHQVIPVQGEHWEAWSHQQKTFQNTSFYKSPAEAGTIKKNMIDERMKQVELCQQIGPFMKMFIDNLWQFCRRENECQIFVSLVKNLLDDRSRKVLPQFQSQYLSAWRSLKTAKEKKKSKQLLTNY